MTQPYIDYSQYRDYLYCPLFWYEKHVNKRTLSYPTKERDDALALGSLVHEGLRIWQEQKIISIPQNVINEINPSYHTLTLAHLLVEGYVRTYPIENFTLTKQEEPLPFTLSNSNIETKGIAKLDSYFYVPESTTISTSTEELYLTKGWWIQEYKTKAQEISRALFYQKYQINLQPSFQLLALREKLNLNPQGVVISVLEKPRPYVPKRKCKQCSVQYEFALWIESPSQEGYYQCPVCSNTQKLQKLDIDKLENDPSLRPSYFKFIIQREEERLKRDEEQIAKVAAEMAAYSTNPLEYGIMNTENCINPLTKKQCMYWNNHVPSNRLTTLNDSNMINVEDYLFKSHKEESAIDD